MAVNNFQATLIGKAVVNPTTQAATFQTIAGPIVFQTVFTMPISNAAADLINIGTVYQFSVTTP